VEWKCIQDENLKERVGIVEKALVCSSTRRKQLIRISKCICDNAVMRSVVSIANRPYLTLKFANVSKERTYITMRLISFVGRLMSFLLSDLRFLPRDLSSSLYKVCSRFSYLAQLGSGAPLNSYFEVVGIGW